MNPIDDSDKLQRNELIKAAMRQVLKETNGDIKVLLKEALKEWMDDKYSAAAKWGFHWFLVSVIGLLGYLLLWKAGWTPPK